MLLIYEFIMYMLFSCVLCLWMTHKHPEDKWSISKIVLMLLCTPLILVGALFWCVIKCLYWLIRMLIKLLWSGTKLLYNFIVLLLLWCVIFVINVFKKITTKKPTDRPLYICDPDKNKRCPKVCCGDSCLLTFEREYSVDGVVVGTELGGPVEQEAKSSI